MSEPQGEVQPITDEQRQAVRKLMFTFLRAETPDLNEKIEIFEYNFIAPTGNITLRWEPGDGFIDWAIRTSDRVVRQTIEAAHKTLVDEGKVTEERKRKMRGQNNDGRLNGCLKSRAKSPNEKMYSL